MTEISNKRKNIDEETETIVIPDYSISDRKKRKYQTRKERNEQFKFGYSVETFDMVVGVFRSIP